MQSLGLAYTATLQRYVSFSKRYQVLSESKVVEVADEGEGVCRVVWEIGTSPGTFETIWFDRQRGYSPIRIELRNPRLSADLLQMGETTWQQVDGIWVPRTFLGENFDGSGKMESRMELALEWESVNHPVPEELFTAAGIGLPPETQIVSFELGSRTALGPVGGERSAKPLATAPIQDGRARMVAVAVSCGLLVSVGKIREGFGAISARAG